MAKYKVTGTKAFLGHKPGEVFDADLPEGQLQRALDRGSISRSKAQTKDDADPADSSTNEKE